MLERFRGGLNRPNLMLLLSAAVLSTILWSWVTLQDDPETTRTYSGVPVQIQGASAGLDIATDVVTVQVTLSGPESVINPIVSSQLLAIADASAITSPGTFSVPLELDHPGGVWRISMQPEQVTLVAEAFTSRQFPLEVTTTQPGLASMRILGVRPETTTVTISGPDSAVSKVVRVVLPVDAGQQVRTFAADFEPAPLDAQDQVVENVIVDPETVGAVVEMSSRGKSIAVLVTLEGNPAPGFEVSDRAVNPSTVVIDGPDDLLAELVAIRTEPVDLTGATASFGTSVALEALPEGLTIVQPASGIVDVFVEITQPGVTLELPEMPVNVMNAEAGLSVMVVPQTVSVTVTGPSEVLAALDSQSVQVIVDLAGLQEGTHILTPSVLVPPQVQWTATNPEQVQLELSQPAATPAGAAKAEE